MNLSYLKFRVPLAVWLLPALGIMASPTLNAAQGYTAINTTTQQKDSHQGTVKVTGTVIDSSGEPVIGASILVKGSSIGAATDIDGKFSIDAPAGSTLQVTYVGCEPYEFKASSTPVEISLKDSSELLDEVVVVGFGTQKKVNLTGSVGVATAKDFESRPVANATQALQGMVPGLNITSSTGEIDKTPSINVRGQGTIGDGSSGSPLILIDGVEGDLNTVNPQDIESVSVLKDAAASSIYGARAPFGVILITTKSGQKGKISINYNNSFRISSPINMPEMMDSYSFALFFNSAAVNRGDSPVFDDEMLQKMLDYQSGKLTTSLDVKKDNANQWEDVWTKGYANTDWYKETYKSEVFSMEHNVSLNGGNDRAQYYASFNYLDQGGLLKLGDDGLKRYNAAGKLSVNVTNWLKVRYNTRFTRSDKDRPTYIANSSFYDYMGRQSWPNLPLYDPNGNYMSNFPSILLATGGKRKVVADQNFQQAAIILEPVKNWITNIELNYSTYNERMKQTTLPFNGYNADGSMIDKKEDTSLEQSYQNQDYINFNIYSAYDFNIKQKHNFHVMGGVQIEKMKQEKSSFKKYGVMVDDKPVFNLTTGLNGNGEPKDPSLNGETNQWRTAGFFGRINYNYDSRYLLEANLRYDGSSRFRRGTRWVASPSFSIGWNIAQENFWESIYPTINTLKLRASYGKLSNQNTSAWYPTYRVMNLGFNNGGWLHDSSKPSTASVGGLISTVLTWESVKSWNVGLDWGLFNNRLTGSADIFTRFTKNMVGPAPVLPSTLGISAPKTNNCDLKTKGWEISVTWKDRLQNGLFYSATVSLSDSKTIIDNYTGNTNKSVGINQWINGRETEEIWGFETIGIAKTQEEMDAHLEAVGGQSSLGSRWGAGDIMYADLDGNPGINRGSGTIDDHGDLKLIGNRNPHYFFSIDLSGNWKGFDIRCFFQGIMKRDYWAGGNFPGMLFGVDGNQSMWHARALTEHMDYFRAEPIGLEGYQLDTNLDAYYPRPLFREAGKNQQTQTRYLQDASYIRLKNLQVGYSIPSHIMNKIGLTSCRIFISGENLWTGTKLSNLFDPETISGGDGGNAYPLSRTWSFGLNVSF